MKFGNHESEKGVPENSPGLNFSGGSEEKRGIDADMLKPNPMRQQLRALLTDARRRGYAARRAYKLTKMPMHLQARKYHRQMERQLSKELAQTPPFLIASTGEESWVGSGKHFFKFRHSSRLAHFLKKLIGSKLMWIRRN